MITAIIAFSTMLKKLKQNNLVNLKITALLLLFFLPLANLMMDNVGLGVFEFTDTTQKMPWTLRPSGLFEINEDKYRGRRLDLNDKTISPKILFLGDSSTYGFGVKNRDTFVSVTENNLNNIRFQKARCVNGGVSGYSLREMIFRYKIFKHWRPDLIFIMAGAHFREIERIRKTPVPFSDNYRGTHLLLNMVFKNPFSVRQEENTGESIAKWQNLFGKFIDEILQDGGQPVLLVYPSREVADDIREQTIQVATLKKIPYIDLYKYFGFHQDQLHLFDRLHPNVKGHKLIGAIVSNWIDSKWPDKLYSINDPREPSDYDQILAGVF